MSLNTATRRLPPSNAKPPGERNKRREGFVEGAPVAEGSFSLSVTECHATHLPIPIRRTEQVWLTATSQKRQVRADWAISIIDPTKGDCLMHSRADWYAAGAERL